MAVRLSPTAQIVRGSLFSYIRPRLAMDSKPHAMAMVTKAVEGVTGANFRSRQPAIVNAMRRYTQGRLAQDNGIEDLAALLGALAPETAQLDQAPGLGQIATNPGGSAGGMSVTPAPADNGPAGGGGMLDLIIKYLTEEGVAPEIVNNIPAIAQGGAAGGAGGGGPSPGAAPPGPDGNMPSGMDAIIPRTQPGMDQEEIEGEPGSGAMRVMEPRGGAESDWRTESADSAGGFDEGHEGHDPWAEATGDEAEDEITPGEQDEQMGGVAQVSSSGTPSRVVNGGQDSNRPVSKAAMDHAIRVAQDAAIRNQRAIRDAERFVRAWVGDMAMDANHPADIYRGALKALGVKGADKVHPDALRPILEAQPRPGARQYQQQPGQNGRRVFAQDSGVEVKGSFLDRFPDAAKISTMA